MCVYIYIGIHISPTKYCYYYCRYYYYYRRYYYCRCYYCSTDL